MFSREREMQTKRDFIEVVGLACGDFSQAFQPLWGRRPIGMRLDQEKYPRLWLSGQELGDIFQISWMLCFLLVEGKT
jgi:hypothetical protein